MDEWLKRHTYIVCGSLNRAKVRMKYDLEQQWKFHNVPEAWKVYPSKMKIVSDLEIYRYISTYQVLHYFDAVDDVDLFELDDTCSLLPKDRLKTVIEALYSARTPRSRELRRVKWFEEHDYWRG